VALGLGGATAAERVTIRHSPGESEERHDMHGTSRSAFDRVPLLTLSAGAALISLAPILVKAASLRGVGPTAIAMWRCAFGALLLLGAAAVARLPLRLPRAVAVLMLAAGLAFAIDLWIWHRAILLVGAGMATILANTQVFVTAILCALFFGERLTARFLVAATSGMAGVALLVGVGSDVEFSAGYLRGVVYGLGTGFAYATFLVLLLAAGRRAREGSALVRICWFSAFAAAFLLAALGGEQERVLAPDWIAWLLLLALALIAQSFGWWVISTSLIRVRGAVAALVLLLQPVLATVWGALLFGERLEPLQSLGALVTLAAVYAGSRKA